MRNTVAGGVGTPYVKKVGIPQGDPLSMLFAALILRAWAQMMVEEGVTPFLFVDDMMVLAEHEEEEEAMKKFVRSLEKTHRYLEMMGAKTAAKKVT